MNYENTHLDPSDPLDREVDQSVAYDAEADSVAYPPSPYDPEWDMGYLPGSGENMYDESYIDYLNKY